MPRKRGKGTKKGRKPHKGIYHPPGLAVGSSDPDSIWNHMQRFTRWQREKNYSPHTIENGERIYRASGHEHFNGSLLAPICDARGRVAQVKETADGPFLAPVEPLEGQQVPARIVGFGRSASQWPPM